eukprot:scaffold86732_cov35-Tisochrysis_lutea.AAC.1
MMRWWGAAATPFFFTFRFNAYYLEVYVPSSGKCDVSAAPLSMRKADNVAMMQKQALNWSCTSGVVHSTKRCATKLRSLTEINWR